MITLKNILDMFPFYQLVSLCDEDGSSLPQGTREKCIDLLFSVYADNEVLNMRIVGETLYIRINTKK